MIHTNQLKKVIVVGIIALFIVVNIPLGQSIKQPVTVPQTINDIPRESVQPTVGETTMVDYLSDTAPPIDQGLKQNQGWWDGNWRYRQEITIDHTKVVGDLENFPVLIKTIMNVNEVQSDGDDIVFTDNQGMKLNHEIESYNNITGNLIAWVNVTSLSSLENTILWLYYGNSMCPSQQNNEGTWDGSYYAVWHFNNNQWRDSTSHHRDLSDGTNTSTALVDGVIGTCAEFNGTNRLQTVIPYTDLKNFALELWIYPESTEHSYAPISKSNNSEVGYYSYDWYLTTEYDSGSQFMLKVHAGGWQRLYWDQDAGQPLNTWQYYTINYFNGQDAFGWRHPTPINNDEPEGAAEDSTTASDMIRIGGMNDIGSIYLGQVDEIRISTSPRNENWHVTSYNNMINPASFITIGQEELGNFPPVANFTYTPENPTTNRVIQFTDTSTDSDGTITSWLWDFGDGNTSTLQNPTHQYNTPGNYSVNLSITDNDGASDFIEITITVTQSLVNILYPTDDTVLDKGSSDPNHSDGAYPLIVIRNEYGAGGYDIFEADGLVKFDISLLHNAVISSATLHLYYFEWDDNNPAGRPLNLYRITSNWDEDTARWNNQPTYAPQPIAYATVPSSYEWMSWNVTNDVQLFINRQANNYGWKITDETYWGDGNIPQTCFRTKEYGNYIPYLEIVVSNQQNQPPVANFTYSPTNPKTNDWIQFTDTSTDNDGTIVSWSWDFGDGTSSPQQSSLHNIKHYYLVSGNYTASLCVIDDKGATTILTKTICVSPGFTADIYVDDDYVDYLPEWGVTHFNTIQHGIDAVTGTGSVYVFNGFYQEHVAVDKSIRLTGESNDNTIVDGSSTGTVFTITADDVVLSGFKVQHGGNSGVFLQSTSNVSIVGNSVEHNGYGIDVRATSNGNLISENTITGNNRGVFIYDDSNENTISKNAISGNTQDGIRLEHLCVENQIFENTISQCANGMYLYDASNNNNIYHNNLMGNTKNARDYCTINYWDDGYPSGGNYWSNYAGVDHFKGPSQNEPGRDGIGDTSYNVYGGGNRDHYPFMYRTGWVDYPPNVRFTVEPESPTTTDVVMFTDQSSDIDGTVVSWLWSFGDGTFSTEQNPTHRYLDDGVYTITLNVTDDDGSTNETSQEITVLNVVPTADFLYNPSNPTSDDVIQFTDTSTDSDGTITTWNWDFGDGNTSALQNPSYQYFTVGTYNVSLTVTDNDNAFTSIVKTILVTEAGVPENWTEMQMLLASDGATGDWFGFSVSLSGDTALIGAVCDDGSKGSAYVFTFNGTTWNEQAKLLASDGTAGDEFGYSVSLSGDTALIGAQYDDDNGQNSGSVYVFDRTGSTWTQQAKLLASDGKENDNFGFSVSLSGDTALIGTPKYWSNGYGSAYVFTRDGTTWTQQVELNASNHAIGDTFGFSVSLTDDTALIGAVRANGNGVSSGSAYVFTRTGTSWIQQAELLALDGATGDNFGYSVSLDNNTALISAVWNSDNGQYSGSAYVFTRTGSTWAQQAKLLASDGVTWDQFGYSVSLDGDTVIIGTPKYQSNGDGSAYVFIRTGTTWAQQAELLASNGVIGDTFGFSVSLDGDTALIGAVWANSNGVNAGSAYVFTRAGTAWTQQAELIASAGYHFGCSVSLSGDTALIGAPYDDDNGQDSGSVYVFTKEGVNQPPIANFTYTPENPTNIDIIQFTDTSSDSDGTIVSWFWNFGNGNTSTLQNPTYRYIHGGTYTVTLTVTDDDGSQNTMNKTIIVTTINHPPNTPTTPLGPTKGIAGIEYAYSTQTTDPDGDFIKYGWDWDGNYIVDTWTSLMPSGVILNIHHLWPDIGSYTIRVKAKDKYGLESNWSIPLTVNIYKLGDVNNDGMVTFADIDPFVAAIGTTEAQFQAQHPSWTWLAADCNQDGKITFADIDPFVALIGTK